MDWTALGKLGAVSAGVLFFLILIALDVRKAIKRRTHWVPGKALVLSALTIQLLTVLSAQTTSSIAGGRAQGQARLMVHVGRVMICVFVGNLLPVMARAGSKNYRTRLIALLCTISFQIASEIYSINRPPPAGSAQSGYAEKRRNGIVATLTTGTVLGSILLLLLLLATATLASKSIHDLVRQKIPIILAPPLSVGESWQAIEDQVLKSWMAAKFCQPEYIIARSVLVCTAGAVVTGCVIVSVVGLSIQGVREQQWESAGDADGVLRTLIYTVIGLQCAFIALGWTIVCWRWVTAVIFYGRKTSIREFFHSEDFWSRRILDQLDADEARLSAGRKKVLKIRPVRKRIWLPRELLPVLLFLQESVVFFSKCCWLTSEAAICNRYVLGPYVLRKWKGISTDADFERFAAAVDAMRMPREAGDSIWVANREAIRGAKLMIIEGFDDGSRCLRLTDFLTRFPAPAHHGLYGLRGTATATEGGFRYLFRRQPRPLKVDKCFLLAQRPSWKLMAVALLNVLLGVSGASKTATDAVAAYGEAWEIIDMVDDMDPEAHFGSRAADKLFLELQSDVRARRPGSAGDRPVSAVVDKMVEKAKTLADCADMGLDSVNWRDVAAARAVYRVCAGMDLGAEVPGNAVAEELVAAVADVVDGALDRAAEAVVWNCLRWARETREKHLWKALYVAGKVRAVMERLGRRPPARLSESLSRIGFGGASEDSAHDEPSLRLE